MFGWLEALDPYYFRRCVRVKVIAAESAGAGSSELDASAATLDQGTGSGLARRSFAGCVGPGRSP
jgi:hypothetical protein